MNNVISVTDKAVEEIKKILSKAPDNIDGILIGVDKSGCSGYSYKLDYATSSDVTNFDSISKNGVKIYIDPKAVIFLVGSEMDYSTDKLSSRFIFNNPNEKGACGCGESFSF